jgi:type II secretory pathway component PulM
MDDIIHRQRQLQKAIRRVTREIQELKANATSRSVHQTTGKSISTRELADHMK